MSYLHVIWFMLGILIGGLIITNAKDRKIEHLRAKLDDGKLLIKKTQEIMTAFIERNKESKILTCFTNEDLLYFLVETNVVQSAPIKTERCTPHVEILIPIGNDHVAFITMDEKAYEALKGDDIRC